MHVMPSVLQRPTYQFCSPYNQAVSHIQHFDNHLIGLISRAVLRELSIVAGVHLLLNLGANEEHKKYVYIASQSNVHYKHQACPSAPTRGIIFYVDRGRYTRTCLEAATSIPLLQTFHFTTILRRIVLARNRDGQLLPYTVTLEMGDRLGHSCKRSQCCNYCTSCCLRWKAST